MNLFIFIAQCAILLATASDQASVISDDGPESRTRVAVLRLEKSSPLLSSLDPSATTRDGALHKVAEWLMNGVPEAVGFLKDCDRTFVDVHNDFPATMTRIDLSTKLFYVTPAPASTLVTYDLQVVPPAYAVAAPVSLQPSPEALSSSSVTPAVAHVSLPNRLLPIPNPFKLKIQGGSSIPGEKSPASVSGRVVLGAALNFGQIPTLPGQKGMQVWIMNAECLRGALWGHSEFLVRIFRLFGCR